MIPYEIGAAEYQKLTKDLVCYRSVIVNCNFYIFKKDGIGAASKKKYLCSGICMICLLPCFLILGVCVAGGVQLLSDKGNAFCSAQRHIFII